MNPKPKKKKEVVEEAKQLDLEIKEPFKNKFYKVKRDIDGAMLRLEVRKFLKDPLVWAIIVISGILTYYQVHLILENIEVLPSYLPIFKYYSAPSQQLVETKFLYIFPILTGVFLVATILLIARNYNKEKNMVKILLISMLVLAIFMTISLINLVTI